MLVRRGRTVGTVAFTAVLLLFLRDATAFCLVTSRLLRQRPGPLTAAPLGRPVLRSAAEEGGAEAEGPPPSQVIADAVAALAAGEIKLADFERIVREQEEVAAVRGEAKAQEDTAKLTAASTAGLGTVGLVAGGLLDGVLANGAAPWAAPLGAIVLGLSLIHI